MINDGVSPQMRGYPNGGADMNANSYGRPAESDPNNRMPEPREEEAVACAKCG